MPNPGGVYRGCKNCRTRKVKCDQTYPECRKCIKAGKPCPGVAKVGDVMFRHQNEWAAEKVVATSPKGHSKGPQVQSQPSAARNPSTELENTASTHIDVKKEAFITPTIPAFILESRETVLQCFFFNRMMVSIGWLSYLPQIYKSAENGGLFREFIHATSLFVLANQRKNNILMSKARMAYGSALELLRIAVSHPVKRLEDEVLSAIGICRIVERVSCEEDDGTGQGEMHLRGLQKLLEVRNETGQKNSDAVAEMVRSTRAEAPKLLIKHYEQYSFLTEDEEGCGALWEDAEDCDCALLMSRLCTEVSQLRCKVAALKEIFEINILAEALDLDQKLDVWTTGIFPPAWRRHEPHFPQSKARWDSEAGVYTDMHIATFWNQARCARILLAETIQQIAFKIFPLAPSPSLSTIIAQSHDTMNAMADIIICCIPIHLYKLDKDGNISYNRLNGVVGATGIIWPLEIVLRCRGIREDYKMQAREALEKVGTEFGVSQAVSALRDWERWREVEGDVGGLEVKRWWEGNY